MTNLQSNSYDSLKERLSQLEDKTKLFFKTHTGNQNEEEKAEILNLLSDRLEILKEMSKMAYERICQKKIS